MVNGDLFTAIISTVLDIFFLSNYTNKPVNLTHDPQLNGNKVSPDRSNIGFTLASMRMQAEAKRGK